MLLVRGKEDIIALHHKAEELAEFFHSALAGPGQDHAVLVLRELKKGLFLGLLLPGLTL